MAQLLSCCAVSQSPSCRRCIVPPGFTSPLKTNQISSPDSTPNLTASSASNETQERFARADALARELRTSLKVQGAFVAQRVKGQNVFVCWASSGVAPTVGTSIRLSPEIEEECAIRGYALIDLQDRKGVSTAAAAAQTLIVLFSDREDGGMMGIAPRGSELAAGDFEELPNQAELCLVKVMPDAVMRRLPPPPPLPAAAVVEISKPAMPEPEPELEIPAFIARETAEQNLNRRMSIVVGAACVAVGFGIITSAFFFARSARQPQELVVSAAENASTTPALPSPTETIAIGATNAGRGLPANDPGALSGEPNPKTIPSLNAQLHRLPITDAKKDVSLNRGFPQVVAPDDLTGTTPRVEVSSEESAAPAPIPASDVPSSTFTPAAPTIAAEKDSVPIFDLSRTFKAHSGWVTGVAFNQAGNLVSGGWDRQLKVWDVNSGHTIQEFSPEGKRLQAMAYSGDGHRLAVQAEDGSVHILDASSGREINRMSSTGDEGRPKDGWVYSIGFSPDGKYVATALGNKTVRVWDANTGRVVHDLVGSRRPVIYVAFSPGGRMLATGADDKTIAIWDVATGTLLRTLKGHSKSVNAVAFSPDGRLLASASDDKTVRVWDYARGLELYELRGHRERVSCLAFGPKGKWLASGGWDGELRVWDMVSGERVETLMAKKKSVFTIAVGPGGRWLASGTQDGTISLWRLRDGRANGSGGEQ